MLKNMLLARRSARFETRLLQKVNFPYQRTVSLSTSSSENNKDDAADQRQKVMFVGGGKMAEAMISGICANPDSFSVSAIDPLKARRTQLEQKFDISVYESINKAGPILKEQDLVVFSVKPQQVPAASRDFKKVFGNQEDGEEAENVNENLTVVSIIAGLSLKSMRNQLGISKLIRAMPNTPAQEQAGMTVWCCSEDVEEEAKDLASELFASCGEEEQVEGEDMIDACTALSGSGPAYFLLTMEALIDSGVHMGLSRAFCTRLVQQTMYGTSLMAKESDLHPTQLRNDITSPGGTTSHALAEIERGGFRTTLNDGVWAAFLRSRELDSSNEDEPKYPII